MDLEEDQYKKGFNRGYLLSTYQPALFDKLAGQLKDDNPYSAGMLHGKEQRDHDYAKNLLPTQQKERSIPKTKDEPERDKG